MANGAFTADKVLLDLIANSLFDAKLNIDLGDVSLEELFKEAKMQTVLAVTFDVLPKRLSEQNPEIFKKWQTMSFAIAQNNIHQLYSNVKLENLFKKAGINICTIKGFASDYYYSKPHLRQMGDIDFIVCMADVENSKKLLDDNGFICSYEEEDHDFHIRYTKKGEVYEMHKGITSFLDQNGYIEKYISNIFENTEVVNIEGLKITVPDKFAHGLVMLLHMQRHMIDGGGVGLRHLCDWAAFVNSIENDEWKAIFEEKLKSIKLWRFAQVLSKTSAVYLKIESKEWFSEIGEELAQALLEDLIIGGNFGIKDYERYREVAFLAQNGADGNVMVRYFKNYIKKVYYWNQFYKKHKWLLPIGMVAYFFRTSFLLITGKKKMDFNKIQENTTKRNNLYGDIFEMK